MSEPDLDRDVGRVTAVIKDLFDVEAVYRQRERLVFSLSRLHDLGRTEKLLKDRLKLAGYRFSLDRGEKTLLLSIDPKRRFRIPIVNVVLFVLTLFSVYFVPVFLRNLVPAASQISDGAAPSASVLEGLHPVLAIFPRAATLALDDLAAGAGIQFTLALMSILLLHEMGHFIASRRRHIVTSWPYFIPAPNIIGTFGAIIKSKSPFWNRRDLIEVGAAGPIVGWVVALAWLLWGLTQSAYVPVEILAGSESLGFSLEGESILMRLATLAFVGTAPEGFYYQLSEAAFAGWVGLLVTAINLLPIGQLDGGHILYGLSRRRQFILARIALVGLILLGFQSFMWWFFAAFGLAFGVKHPPTLQDERPPGRIATIMGVVSLVILLLSFTPVPFR